VLERFVEFALGRIKFAEIAGVLRFEGGFGAGVLDEDPLRLTEMFLRFVEKLRSDIRLRQQQIRWDEFKSCIPEDIRRVS
jgi:hypothetical protein